MWDIRRNLDPRPLPGRRCVIQFLYRNLPSAKQCWWLVVEPGGEVGLCYSDPGFDIDLYVVTELSTMTSIWMGFTSLASEVSHDRVQLTGSPGLKGSMSTWLRLSPFARQGMAQSDGKAVAPDLSGAVIRRAD